MGNKLFTVNETTLALMLSKNAKIAENYTFKALGKTLIVHEPDFKRLLYVGNLTSERILYNPLKSQEAKLTNNHISFNYSYTDMNDTDDLLIVYEAKENENFLFLLEEIYKQLEKQTILLRKIYN